MGLDLRGEVGQGLTALTPQSGSAEEPAWRMSHRQAARPGSLLLYVRPFRVRYRLSRIDLSGHLMSPGGAEARYRIDRSKSSAEPPENF